MIDYAALAGKSISALVAYKPGKPIGELKRELGIEKVIKLASNESPLGPSPECFKMIQNILPEISRYPLGDAHDLRKVLSDKLNVPVENLVFGSGSNEIIELLLRTFVHEGHVISPAPSFSVYGIIAQAMGSYCEWVPTGVQFQVDLERILNAVTDKTRLIFLANPNNPTGVYVNETDLKHFVSRLPENIILAMDEAYIEFADAADMPDTTMWYKEHPNMVLLRTFSKAYGLAGLRIGYGIGNEVCCAMINRVRQPFNTNMLAQAAAVAALNDIKWLRKVFDNNKQGKEYFYQEFQKLGLAYIPTQANFILVDVKDGEKIFNALLKKGVITRFMGAPLQAYIRISIGSREENEIFISALSDVL